MSNLVFISGDFSSGTTLLFTLFRKTNDFYCLYEPLHEHLLEYLVYPLRQEQHHPFVDPYFTEYRNFREIPALFKPEWGVSHLHLSSSDQADDFYRYWSYLIESAFGRKEKVLIKENRLAFRLGWLRLKFPNAKIIHIYREKDAQWNSIVKRGQEYFGREDIGQNNVAFNGFSIAQWCEDLKGDYPDLDAKNFRSGYERFSRLWELSLAEHKKHSDISVDLHALTHDFEQTIEHIGACIGYQFDTAALRPFVVTPEKREQLPIGANSRRGRVQRWMDMLGWKYSRARVLLEKYARRYQIKRT